jgi:hypothetical protein
VGLVRFEPKESKLGLELGRVAVSNDGAHEGQAGEGGAAAHLLTVAAEHDPAFAHAGCVGDGVVHEPDRVDGNERDVTVFERRRPKGKRGGT